MSDKHGSEYRYSVLRCHCSRCREAHRVMAAKTRRNAQQRGLPADDPRHGTAAGYDYWRCRCGPCRKAGVIKHQHDTAVQAARRRVAAR